MTAGDIVWADLDPVLGTEQAGRRPVLVLTDEIYHSISTRAIVCPISKTRGAWPFNVALPSGMKVQGHVLLDQIRTVHRPSRLFGTIEHAPAAMVSRVRDGLAALIGLQTLVGASEKAR